MMIFRALVALLLMLPAACQAGSSETTKSANGLSIVPLEIRTSTGKVHNFKVEVAQTDAEQARGLMFRDSLGPDAGMIFPMDPARPASFWMKNTVIPLDMIFVRPDGTIARIAPETVPHSLEPVDSGEPVSAVLEIAGGRAAQLGIAEGDKVTWTR
jgi:uncharacterized membrane protein (UPF0127 family)